MLEQIVYTRCFPHRNLENGSVEHDDEGYGIQSLSLGITRLNIDRRLLEKRLATPNASSESQRIGLVNSYDFFPVGDDLNALTFNVARPCGQTPRINGQKHRPGNFVKQGLVGRFDEYPFKWFGAQDWTAYKIPENDYYLDDPRAPQPALLDRARSFPSSGNVDARRVYRFIKEGRGEALKACVWFLLRESVKGASERKVLVVYDDPQNVELWIAAIELAFPMKASQKISFSTNQGSVNESNVLRTLFDREDAPYSDNQEDSSETRTPRFMIVGVSPKEERGADKFESTFYSETLDGRSKSVGFQPDESIKRPFYTQITDPSDLFVEFRDAFLPSIQYNAIAPDLPQIFEAFQYWFDDKNLVSSNEARVGSLDEIVAIVPEKNPWNRKLLHKGFNKFAPRLSSDPRNALSMTPALCTLASRIEQEDELATLFLKCFYDTARRRPRVAFELSNVLSTTKGRTAETFFTEIFKEESLNKLLSALEGASAEQRLQTLFYFLRQRELEGKSFDSLADDEQDYFFLLQLFVVAVKNDRFVQGVEAIDDSKRLFSRLIWDVFVKTNEEDENVAKRWIVDVFQASPNAFEYLLISGNYVKEDALVLEKILQILLDEKRIGILEAARCLERILDGYGRTDRLGSVLFRNNIKSNPLNDNFKLLQTLKKLELDANVQKELISQFRKAFASKRSFLSPTSLQKELDEWERNLEITVHQEEILYFKRRSIVVGARELYYELEHFQYPLDCDPSDMKDEFIRRIAAKIVQNCFYELHLLLFDSFSFSSSSKLAIFIDAYVLYALEYFEDKQLRIEVAKSLLRAARKRYEWKKSSRRFENDAQDLLEKIWRKHSKRFLDADSLARIDRAIPNERTKKTSASLL